MKQHGEPTDLAGAERTSYPVRAMGHGFSNADWLIKAQAHWIADGGPQDQDTGAYCGWVRLGSMRSSPPYSEITGYLLTYSLWAQEFYPHDLSRISRAADWLAARYNHGDFSARPERTGSTVYTFDVAMAAHGLLQWGIAHSSDVHMTAGFAGVALLLKSAEIIGNVPSVIPNSNHYLFEKSWSTAGNIHLLKLVQVLLMAEALGLDGAGALADQLATRSLPGMFDTENFPPETDPGNQTIGLHPLCYAAEGLWIWGMRRGSKEAIQASRQITTWIWGCQFDGGGFPGFVAREGTPISSILQNDVLAQALRLAYLHGMTSPKTEAAATVLLASCWNNKDKAAIIYQIGMGVEVDLNSWASMFSIQALTLRNSSRASLRWDQLV